MTNVKPTPTQEEIDAHIRGERLESHELDGSPEDNHGRPVNHTQHGENSAAAVMARLKAEGWKEAKTEPAEAPPKKEKSLEAAHGASYKTRQAQPEKQRKADKDKDHE